MTLPIRIVIGMLTGTATGFAARLFFAGSPGLAWFNDNVAYFLGQLFLRLIFMVVVPLVASSLVLGVVELGDVRKLGRIGMRSLLWTGLLSAISVGIGIGLVELVRPGEMVKAEVRDELRAKMIPDSKKLIENALGARKPVDAVLGLIPKNPLQAAVNALEGETLALMVFSLFVGIALTLVDPEKARPITELAEGVLAVSMKIIDFAMSLAPVAVAALLFSLVVRTGADLLASLAGYVAVVVLGLALQLFVVYSIVLTWRSRWRPAVFFRQTREALLTAFSTASSSATLPTTLRVSEENLGIPRQIGSFVLTVGAMANQNGTALFEGVTVLFLAQLFGVELTFGQQLAVVFMSILAGIGTAGVPGGSIPLIVIVLQTVGVPAEGIGTILGVDRLLDMCRTTLNVAGDLVIAALVASDEVEAS